MEQSTHRITACYKRVHQEDGDWSHADLEVVCISRFQKLFLGRVPLTALQWPQEMMFSLLLRLFEGMQRRNLRKVACLYVSICSPPPGGLMKGGAWNYEASSEALHIPKASTRLAESILHRLTHERILPDMQSALWTIFLALVFDISVGALCFMASSMATNLIVISLCSWNLDVHTKYLMASSQHT